MHEYKNILKIFEIYMLNIILLLDRAILIPIFKNDLKK